MTFNFHHPYHWEASDTAWKLSDQENKKRQYQLFTTVFKPGFPQKGSRNNGAGRTEHFQATAQTICTRRGFFPEARDNTQVK
jgi:hypothetical protein